MQRATIDREDLPPVGQSEEITPNATARIRSWPIGETNAANSPTALFIEPIPQAVVVG